MPTLRGFKHNILATIDVSRKELDYLLLRSQHRGKVPVQAAQEILAFWQEEFDLHKSATITVDIDHMDVSALWMLVEYGDAEKEEVPAEQYRLASQYGQLGTMLDKEFERLDELAPYGDLHDDCLRLNLFDHLTLTDAGEGGSCP